MPDRSIPTLTKLAFTAVSVVGLTGCEVGSYFDPSIIGRWERTPTTVPILERISVIEPESDQVLDIEDIRPEDLVPESREFEIRSGDLINITIFDLPVRGQQTPFQRPVLSTGEVDLPGVGRVYVDGLTAQEAERAIAQLLRDKDLIVGDPIVTVDLFSSQEATYTMLGAVAGAGPYQLNRPSLRLLDAIAAAGGIDETAPEILIIRQIPLSEKMSRPRADRPDSDPAGGSTDTDPDDLINLIDGLLDDGGESPAVFATAQPAANGQPIDLIDDDAPNADDLLSGNWISLDGEWVRVAGKNPGGLPEVGGGLADAEGLEDLVTQRVISVPTDRLLAGDARVNVVVRAGDVIRIPPVPQGQIYMAGFVNRPGAFALARNLTLLRAVDSAGGLNGLAIPERVDLTRMVGPDRQATIRLNLRAIAEQTQPDIFLKPNDRINVGTNFWAFPLAVIRGGFRATYGFGFLLDRNFGTDVFGAPPGLGNPGEVNGIITLF